MFNNRYSTSSADLINTADDDMLICGMENGEIISPDDSMIHSGFPEEIINFGSTGTTTISSPSLSDVMYSVSGGNSTINGYFESVPPLPLSQSLLNGVVVSNNVGINTTQSVSNDYIIIQNESTLNIEENKRFMHHVI